MNKLFIMIFCTAFIFSQNIFADSKLTKVGYLSEIYADLKYKNSKSALRIWIEDITKDAGINVQLITYESYDKLVSDYVNGKLQILAVNPYHYLEKEKKINNQTNIIWDLQRSKDEKFQKLYVVVNKNSKIEKISDLKNKKIIIKKNNYMARVFLETLYFKSEKNSSKAFMSKIDTLEKGTVLLKTFFGKHDACIVDSYEYEVMLELNPALSQKLKILKSSENMLNNHMILFSKNNNEETMKIYRKTLDKFLTDVRKNDLFDLIKTNKISLLKVDELEKLRNLYLLNKKLKKKYNK